MNKDLTPVSMIYGIALDTDKLIKSMKTLQDKRFIENISIDQ